MDEFKEKVKDDVYDGQNNTDSGFSEKLFYLDLFTKKIFPNIKYDKGNYRCFEQYSRLKNRLGLIGKSLLQETITLTILEEDIERNLNMLRREDLEIEKIKIIYLCMRICWTEKKGHWLIKNRKVER